MPKKNIPPIDSTSFPAYIRSNFARKRKLEKALQGVAINTHAHKPREWASKSIRTWMGKNELGLELKNSLLVCVDSRYSNYEGNKFCMKYIRNDAAFKYFCMVLDGKTEVSLAQFLAAQEDVELSRQAEEVAKKYDYELVAQLMLREHETELKTKKFNMKEIGPREYHPIQNMRKAVRAKFLAEHGLPYDYDIEAAAPSLLYERALRCEMKQELPMIKALVNDPVSVRYTIWSNLNKAINELNKHYKEMDCDSTVKAFTLTEVKRIINAFFCGARVCYKTGSYQNYALSDMLGNNQMKLIILSGDEYCKELKKEITKLWSAIKPHETHRKSIEGRSLPLSSKQKWGIYFRLENEVMTAVKGALDRMDIKYLTMHDGMQTDKMVDTQWLSAEVFTETGYRVKFSSNAEDDCSDELFIDDDYENESDFEIIELDSIFETV